MGFFDFVTKKQVKNISNNIGEVMCLIEDELEKSSRKNDSEIRGMALGLTNEKEKLLSLISKMSRSNREKLRVKYKDHMVHYFTFIGEMKRMSDKVDKITGIKIF